MICYIIPFDGSLELNPFQTKLTYDMICYNTKRQYDLSLFKFQTKLTYDMICYINNGLLSEEEQ